MNAVAIERENRVAGASHHRGGRGPAVRTHHRTRTRGPRHLRRPGRRRGARRHRAGPARCDPPRGDAPRNLGDRRLPRAARPGDLNADHHAELTQRGARRRSRHRDRCRRLRRQALSHARARRGSAPSSAAVCPPPPEGARPRRGAAASSPILSAGGVVLDPERHEVTVVDREIEIPLREFQLLRELLEHAGRVVTRDELLERVWGLDYDGDPRIVATLVGRLRARHRGRPGQSNPHRHDPRGRLPVQRQVLRRMREGDLLGP